MHSMSVTDNDIQMCSGRHPFVAAGVLQVLDFNEEGLAQLGTSWLLSNLLALRLATALSCSATSTQAWPSAVSRSARQFEYLRSPGLALSVLILSPFAAAFESRVRQQKQLLVWHLQALREEKGTKQVSTAKGISPVLHFLSLAAQLLLLNRSTSKIIAPPAAAHTPAAGYLRMQCYITGHSSRACVCACALQLPLGVICAANCSLHCCHGLFSWHVCAISN